jgi:hypothetical protein
MKTRFPYTLRQRLLLPRSSTRALILAAVAGMFLGSILGQGVSGSSHHPQFDPKKSLPLGLLKAYGLAVKRMGVATNHFHCVTASCVETTNLWSTGWKFAFSSPDGNSLSIKVFFTGDVWLDAESESLVNANR